MATVEQTERMIVEIQTKVPRSESKIDLSGENGKIYERLKKQINEIVDNGGAVEIPGEIDI